MAFLIRRASDRPPAARPPPPASPPPFDSPESMFCQWRNAQTFLANFERMAADRGWSDAEKIRHLANNLTGSAQLWYEIFSNDENIADKSWANYAAAFLHEFRETRRDFEIQLLKRNHRENESVKSFFDAVLELYKKYQPTFNFNEFRLYFESGLNRNLWREFCKFRKPRMNLRKMQEAVIRLDRYLSEQEQEQQRQQQEQQRQQLRRWERERESNYNERRHLARRLVPEHEVQQHMRGEVVANALAIGLNVERVKRAIRENLELHGRPFANADALVEAVIRLQHEENESISETDDAFGNVMLRRFNRPLMGTSYIPIPGVQQHVVAAASTATRAPETARKSPPKDKRCSLEEENRQLKEARLCKICMDLEVGIVFLPCGHLATCLNCAANLEVCPVCRSPIKATVRTFLS